MKYRPMPIADMRGKNVGAAESVNMRTGSARTRGRLAIGAMLAAAIIIGFAAETASLFDEFWLTVLAVIAPLALLLTAALAVSLGGKVPLPSAVVSGVAAGWAVGIMFVLGTFSPFALEVGRRDVEEYGGDLAGPAVLFLVLIIWGVGGGSLLGAGCGTAAWVLRISLAQRPSDRKPDTREASR